VRRATESPDALLRRDGDAEWATTWAVTCPGCGACAGQACHVAGLTGVPLAHASRVRAGELAGAGQLALEVA
jgi:hypothetical protein